MKKLILKCIFFFICSVSSAQVGINNTDPKASLDITASNVATPSNTDGILIPRIDNFPTINPGADQDGMLVYATGNGTPSRGFYYWDNATTSWLNAIGSNDSDFFEIGSTSTPNNISDDIYTLGKIKIGQNSAAASPLSIHDWNPTNTSSLSISRSLSSAGSGTMTAISTALDAQSTDNYFGIQSTLSGTTQVDSGNYNALSFGILNGNTHLYKGVFYSASGTGRLYGNHVGFLSTVTNSGDKYGYYANIPSTLSGTHYGIYNDVQNSSGYAAYLIGRTSLGESTVNRYLMPAADGTSGQVMTTDGSGNLSFATPNVSSGTLDEAYDFGGAGLGKTITADTGAVRINGTDGFLVTGTVGSGTSIDTEITGAGTRMFFNPNKAAFRAGRILGSQWDNINIGDYSTSLGINNTASGIGSTALGGSNSASGNYSSALGIYSIASGTYSTALGFNSTASGNYSTVFGRDNTAPSGYETVIGTFSTNYTPNSTSNFHSADRLFVIGNGLNSAARSDALIIYKDGRMNINNAFTLPTTDGTSNQVLTTDGSGNVSWSTPTTAGNTLDQAYDQGGAGVGRTINVDSGLLSFTGASEILTLSSSNLNSNYDNTLNISATLNGNYNSGIYQNISGTNPTASPSLGASYAMRNYINHNTTNGVTYGLYNQFVLGTNSGASLNTGYKGVSNSFYSVTNANGTNIGVENIFSRFSAENVGVDNYFQTNAGNTYGIRNRATSSLTTGFSGVYNYLTNNSGSNATYGEYTRISNTGNGDDYGNYIYITSTQGNQYGVYSRVTDLTSGYAAYLVGRTSLGNATTNRYTMPAGDGTANQVMTTDGSGNVSWTDSSSNFSLMRATLSSNQALGTGGWEKLDFDTTTFDLNSEFNPTTDRFVASSAGYYRIKAQYHTSTTQGNEQEYGIGIYINGSLVQEFTTNHYDNSVTDGLVVRQISMIANLSASDYVEIGVKNSQSGVSIDSWSGKTNFEIERIR